MFEKLRFANGKEKEDFEKYRRLKGTYLHLQVYNLLLEKNGANGVTYEELSSHIRYDKNLRDLLYIYFATLEEWLRAKLLERFDVPEGSKKYEYHCFGRLQNELNEKHTEISNLYYLLGPDFSDLMRICVEKDVTQLNNDQIKRIKDLRNKIMHHNLLRFGVAKDCNGLYAHFNTLEDKLNALLSALPPDYQQGLLTEIKALNGKSEKKYLKYWYLEIDENGRIRIKE